VTQALRVEDLRAGYRGAAAIRGVSFSCDAGQIMTILGPNGSGKTTTLLATAGFLSPTAGNVSLFGTRVTGRASHAIAREGMVLVPDDRGLFPTLTVGQHLRLAERSAAARRKHDSEGLARAEVLDLFPALAPLIGRQCSTLSGGEQQMLAVAKALLLAPRVLLIDEMSLGLAPQVVETLLGALRGLVKRTGMALILVEQHYELALAVATDAIVMGHGEVVLADDAQALLSDPARLEAAYFSDGR